MKKSPIYYGREIFSQPLIAGKEYTGLRGQFI